MLANDNFDHILVSFYKGTLFLWLYLFCSRAASFAGYFLINVFLLQRSNDAKPMEDFEPQFTLQELQDVLQERNELKVQVFTLQEELAYYKRYNLDQKTSCLPICIIWFFCYYWPNTLVKRLKRTTVLLLLLYLLHLSQLHLIHLNQEYAVCKSFLALILFFV